MRNLVCGALALVMTAAAANADVLANYNFTSGSRASTDTDANTVASTFDGGSGFQTAGVDNSTIDLNHGNPAPAIFIDSTFTDGTTQSAAVTANDFFTFTISPASGFTFSLSSLSFDYANTSTTTTFPTENFFVRSSADNFSANLAGAVTAAAGSNGTFASTTITLSGNSALQNLSSPIEFRIYVYDGTNTSGRGALLDNVTLNGTTLAAVPEPSTWVSFLGGAGVLLGVARLRARRS